MGEFMPHNIIRDKSRTEKHDVGVGPPLKYPSGVHKRKIRIGDDVAAHIVKAVAAVLLPIPIIAVAKIIIKPIDFRIARGRIAFRAYQTRLIKVFNVFTIIHFSIAQVCAIGMAQQ